MDSTCYILLYLVVSCCILLYLAVLAVPLRLGSCRFYTQQRSPLPAYARPCAISLHLHTPTTLTFSHSHALTFSRPHALSPSRPFALSPSRPLALTSAPSSITILSRRLPHPPRWSGRWRILYSLSVRGAGNSWLAVIIVTAAALHPLNSYQHTIRLTSIHPLLMSTKCSRAASREREEGTSDDTVEMKASSVRLLYVYVYG